MTSRIFISAIASCIVICLTTITQAQVPPASAPSAAVWPSGVDRSKLQDQAARAAIDQIEKKLASVKSFSCTINLTSYTSRGNVAYIEEACFSRPNLHFKKLNQTEHIIPNMVGSINYGILDGKTCWNYNDTKKILSTVNQTILSQSISSLAFIEPGYARLLEPFRYMDSASLRIFKEDDATWTFSASPIPMLAQAHINSVRVVIGKKDGVLQACRFFGAEDKIQTAELISNVVLNPTLPANQFSFTPPPGVTPKDDTASMIQSLKRQGL